VRDFSDHFFIRHIKQLAHMPTATLVRQTEMEAIALLERNHVLGEENEKLKTYADINWLKRELDALTERVAKLEAPK